MRFAHTFMVRNGKIVTFEQLVDTALVREAVTPDTLFCIASFSEVGRSSSYLNLTHLSLTLTRFRRSFVDCSLGWKGRSGTRPGNGINQDCNDLVRVGQMRVVSRGDPDCPRRT